MTDLLYPFTTLSFAYPWVFLLPLLIYLGVRLRKPAQTVSVPSGADLRVIPRGFRARVRGPLLTALSIAAVIALTTAAARPQRLSNLPTTAQARNLLLAIDVSRSMETIDFASPRGRISRMQAVKQVLPGFLEARAGDRIGIVVFGSSAFLQSPLTLDHKTLQRLVEAIPVGIAGDGTAIGDGLGLSLKRLKDLPATSSAVVLLTDGVNNSGEVDPLRAAAVAKDLKITVHTIGIGSYDPVARGGAGVFFPSSQAEPEFDERTLQRIAELTGGTYQNASSVEGLQKVYAALDTLTRTEDVQPSQKLVEELFLPYALAGMLAFFAALVLQRFLFVRGP